ncbi:MAG: ABC transporter ATP-binding protein, partial [Archaeoglobaceae archaeon]
MKQRLGLAQALINDPEVVFLDEPTTGLDPAGAADFRRIIRQLKRDGKTVFFSSHVLSEVKEVCETIGIIHRGKILAKGRIEDFSSKTRIAVQSEPKASEELLKKFGNVSYDEKSDVFVIEADGDRRVEIAKFLFNNGYIVKELHLIEPSLEEIYLSLVGE